MPDSDLPSILTTLKQSPDNITHFSEAWSQGRAAFGGLAAAFAVGGMSKLLATPQPLRSLMVSFVAPLPAGEVKVNPVLVRQGKNVTQATADVLAAGQICLQAMAVFGNARDGITVAADEKFDAPAKGSGVSIADHRKRLPEFLQYFDGYWTGKGMPFSGSSDRTLSMWVKHRSDMSDFPSEKMIAIADIPPPVVLSHYSKPPVHASSLSWSLEFIVPPEEIRGDWFYLDFYLHSADNGYCQQSGKVFDENGQLCAISRQCMVYFEPRENT